MVISGPNRPADTIGVGHAFVVSVLAPAFLLVCPFFLCPLSDSPAGATEEHEADSVPEAAFAVSEAAEATEMANVAADTTAAEGAVDTTAGGADDTTAGGADGTAEVVVTGGGFFRASGGRQNFRLREQRSSQDVNSATSLRSL